MKTQILKKIFFLSILVFLNNVIAKSQLIITSTDTISIIEEPVILQAGEYIGDKLEWEVSENLIDWNLIPTKNDSLEIPSSINAYYRAKITALDCDPFYSDTIRLVKKNGATIMVDSYKAVVVGSQIWMAENLNIITANSYCYDDNLDNCDIYGRLYSYNAAINACPSGWHLPSDKEWKQLELSLKMSQIDADSQGYRGNNEGQQLKAKGLVEKGDGLWYKKYDHEGTNETAFSALPAGYRYSDGSYSGLGFYTYFWTSTTNGENSVWNRYIDYKDDRINRSFYNYTSYGKSVRCVRD